MRDQSLAVVPAGEDYGDADAGLNDRLLFGGARAFQADASCWDTLVNSSLGLHQKLLNGAASWISETLLHDVLHAAAVRVAREPLAHCILTSERFCKYPTELSTSVDLVPDLIEVRPHLCPPILTEPTEPCRPSRDVSKALRIPPLPPGFASDPGLCRLEHKCSAVSGATFAKSFTPAELDDEAYALLEA